MKKIWNIICSYGTIIKIVGRFIIFICLILLLLDAFRGAATKNMMQSIPWPFIITGVVVYCIGWIGTVFERRKKSSNNESDDGDTL